MYIKQKWVLTHKFFFFFILIHHFYLLHFYHFIYTNTLPFMPSHVKYTQIKNNVIYLQFFNDTYLVLTLLFHLILTHKSWLKPRKGSLHFILSGNNNYDFYVNAGRCGFVDFVNDVIDCGCLACVFCFRIKEKERDTFYINFYSIIFLQCCRCCCCVFFFLLITSIE